MPRLPAYDQVVQSIYSAALEPRQWPRALSAVHRALAGSTVTSLAYVERLGQGGLGFTNAEYRDPGWHWQAIQAMEPRCPRFRHATLNVRPGALLFDAQHGHEGAAGDADPCYHWYERELDARFYIAGSLFQSAGRHAYVAVQRSRRQGHVTAAEVRRFRRLLPHLRRAVEINHTVGEGRLASDGLDALAAMPQATAAIDGDGSVMDINAALADVLRQDDGLTVLAGQLRVPRPREQRLVERLLARAVHGGEAAAMALPRPSGRRAFGLVATPVPQALPFFMARRVAALLFVLDPEALPLRPVPAPLLAEAFGLTPMQALVAGQVGRGKTVDATALALDLSRNTVRTHLRDVYRRLGLNHQSDLMSLLAAWPDFATDDGSS